MKTWACFSISGLMVTAFQFIVPFPKSICVGLIGIFLSACGFILATYEAK